MANLIEISCMTAMLRLPGDEIIHRDKRPNVNGPPVPTERRPDYQSMRSVDGRNAVRLERFIESLREYPHAIWINPDLPSLQMIGVRGFPHRRNCEYSEVGLACNAPADHDFVMRDSRDSSSDSRYWGVVRRTTSLGRRS